MNTTNDQKLEQHPFDAQNHSDHKPQEPQNKPKQINVLLPLSIVAGALIIAIAWVYTAKLKLATGTPAYQTQGGSQINSPQQQASINIDEEKIIPSSGVELPVKWGDMGSQMIESGVIDAEKFEALYASRGGLPEDVKQLVYDKNNGDLKITPNNAPILLNLLWALGLGNKNEILDKGPMQDPQYGGAGGFASTGGWSLAEGDAMNHYSKHEFVKLTDEQQKLVKKVADGIYRPCCGNSTYFPDCNHGMAMLGFLQLMASQGLSEQEMYKAALQVNAYWFPENMLTIAKYLETKGVSWEAANPAQVLGPDFFSATGFRQIASEVTPVERKGGGGCGV